VKIKLDENLPHRAKDALAALGHDVDTVEDEGLKGKDDETLWPMVQATGRILITQDIAFADVRHHPPGSHAGVIVLRLKEPGRDALLARLQRLFAVERADALGRCVVVATDRKLRVRRPA
jgi:predicted nuclease of predicted toxin-antitoxin system